MSVKSAYGDENFSDDRLTIFNQDFFSYDLAYLQKNSSLLVAKLLNLMRAKFLALVRVPVFCSFD